MVDQSKYNMQPQSHRRIMVKSKPPSSIPATVAGADLQRDYDVALSILDAAVTSAIISGIQPYTFQPVCSYWFLQTMGMSRMTSLSVEKLLEPPSIDVFEKIVAAVQTFAEINSRDYLENGGSDEEDFNDLLPHRLSISKLDPTGVSQEDKAVQISHYCMGQFEDHEIEPRALELAFMVMYFKVAALTGEHSKDEYLTVKRAVPEVLHAYDDIAWQAQNGGKGKTEALKLKSKNGNAHTDEKAIVNVFEKYLAEGGTASKTGNAKRQSAIELFSMYLNNYGHSQLDADEKSMFVALYSAEGVDHREFGQVFGADKILGAIEPFVDHYLISSVLGSATTLSAYAMEIAKLCKWLKKNKLVDIDRVSMLEDLVIDLAKILPRRIKAGNLLHRNVQANGDNLPVPEVDGAMRVVKIDEKAIWLEDDYGVKFGPIALPKETLDALAVGWNFYCSLSKKGGKWLLAEVGEVYDG